MQHLIETQKKTIFPIGFCLDDVEKMNTLCHGRARFRRLLTYFKNGEIENDFSVLDTLICFGFFQAWFIQPKFEYDSQY